MKITERILRIKPAMCLVLLNDEGITEEKTPSFLSKKVKLSPSYTYLLVEYFHKKIIINIRKKGRRNILTLTENGKELADKIEKIIRLMGD